MKYLKHLKNSAYCAVSILPSAVSSVLPIANAYETQSVKHIVKLINALLAVFQGAGVILLAYSIIALILAFKDENAEAKVNASTQLGVAVFLVTFSTFLKQIGDSVGVSGVGA